MTKTPLLAALILIIAGLAQSCKKDTITTTTDASSSSPATTARTAGRAQSKLPASILLQKAAADFRVDNHHSDILKKLAVGPSLKAAIVPSECASTPFGTLIQSYLSKFNQQEFDLYGLYTTINYFSLFLDESKQYFGAKGEYTSLVVKQQRKLEWFWNMPNEVTIKGEHNNTLNNRNKIAGVYIAFGGVEPEDAYAYADEIIALNKKSAVFVETPLLSFDAFLSPGNFIALGDGIIQLHAETGLAKDVVVSGILAHEWTHQIQFDHASDWYRFDIDEEPDAPEFSRLTELEADFFAGYYLTHKRGNAYNWKRVAQFVRLFYNAGDCAFDDPTHHGTPYQRMAAARLGYILADILLPKSNVLTADQMHALYAIGYNCLVAGTLSPKQALTALKSLQLKIIFKNLLNYKTELQAIANGRLSLSNIENL